MNRTMTLTTLAALILVGCTSATDDSSDGATDDEATTATAPAHPGDVIGEAIRQQSSTGLAWYDIVEGTGDAPTGPQSWVVVHYTGYLEDGTVFDSSRERGEPASFALGYVIPGWTEGVGSMKVGGQRKLIIPGVLAYGAAGSPPKIGPDATLVFDVELLAVDPLLKLPDVLPGEPIGDAVAQTVGDATTYDILIGGGDTITGDESSVQVLLSGFLTDGTEFLSRRPDAAPLTLPMQAIPALGKAIAGMQIGGTRKIVLPSQAMAGPDGRLPRGIPENAILILDIDLLGGEQRMDLGDTIPGWAIDGDGTTTDSGLRYWDVTVGDGPTPDGPTTEVTVHYTGYLPDGTTFDSSVERNTPASFRLDGVIAGWTEGVASMNVGGKRKLVIPADIAYGAGGRPPVIPPNATLIFDIELISLGSPQEAATDGGDSSGGGSDAEPTQDGDSPDTPDAPDAPATPDTPDTDDTDDADDDQKETP